MGKMEGPCERSLGRRGISFPGETPGARNGAPEKKFNAQISTEIPPEPHFGPEKEKPQFLPRGSPI